MWLYMPYVNYVVRKDFPICIIFNFYGIKPHMDCLLYRCLTGRGRENDLSATPGKINEPDGDWQKR